MYSYRGCQNSIFYSKYIIKKIYYIEIYRYRFPKFSDPTLKYTCKFHHQEQLTPQMNL